MEAKLEATAPANAVSALLTSSSFQLTIPSCKIDRTKSVLNSTTTTQAHRPRESARITTVNVASKGPYLLHSKCNKWLSKTNIKQQMLEVKCMQYATMH